MAVWIILLFYWFGLGIAQYDPCGENNHLPLNSPEINTDYVGTNATLPFIANAWYRYTATPSGEMATKCPNRNTCGVPQPIWIDVPLPKYGDGEKEIYPCVPYGGSACCVKGLATIKAKNCNGFYVFQLQNPPPNSSFCFNSSDHILPTVSTTTTTTTPTPTTTVATTTPVVTTACPVCTCNCPSKPPGGQQTSTDGRFTSTRPSGQTPDQPSNRPTINSATNISSIASAIMSSLAPGPHGSNPGSSTTPRPLGTISGGGQQSSRHPPETVTDSSATTCVCPSMGATNKLGFPSTPIGHVTGVLGHIINNVSRPTINPGQGTNAFGSTNPGSKPMPGYSGQPTGDHVSRLPSVSVGASRNSSTGSSNPGSATPEGSNPTATTARGPIPGPTFSERPGQATPNVSGRPGQATPNVSIKPDQSTPSNVSGMQSQGLGAGVTDGQNPGGGQQLAQQPCQSAASPSSDYKHQCSDMWMVIAAVLGTLLLLLITLNAVYLVKRHVDHRERKDRVEDLSRGSSRETVAAKIGGVTVAIKDPQIYKAIFKNKHFN